jgi:DNA polymerase III subunit epsilon
MRDLPSHLVFTDLEVAGGDISRPIIQVAAIAVTHDLEALETFEAKLKFDPQLADPHSLTKNRYCPRVWEAEARSATTVAREFAHFLRRHATLTAHASGGRSYRVAQLVAHNAPFDGPFLQVWFERVGAYFPGDFRMLCTMQRALWLFHEHPNLRRPLDFKLVTLCRYFGVPLHPDEAHTALADVQATVELYRRITLLATAEACNRIGSRPPGTPAITRVGRVAARGHKACRSRRRSRPKTCRSRRRRLFQGRP